MEENTKRNCDKSMTDQSIMQVYDMAVNHFPTGSVFIEVGCYRGQSACYLASAIEKSGKDIKLYCIDKWEDSKELSITDSIFNEFWQNVKKYDKIIKPIMFDSSSALSLFSDVDFIFIDGDHSFEGVTKDLEAAKKAIKADGWIAGHDYSQAVYKAVFKFCSPAVVDNIQNTSYIIKEDKSFLTVE